MASVNKVGKKWRGQISVSGHNVHVGMFKTRKAAFEACEQAKLNNHYSFFEGSLDPLRTPHKKKSLWARFTERYFG